MEKLRRYWFCLLMMFSFYDSCQYLDYIVSNGRVINEMEKILKEGIVAC
jgi:hypothetical protein